MAIFDQVGHLRELRLRERMDLHFRSGEAFPNLSLCFHSSLEKQVLQRRGWIFTGVV
jgi:hypothetical protein